MTCPFCRCEIRSTEQIVVDPFCKLQEQMSQETAKEMSSETSTETLSETSRADMERKNSKNDDESDYSAFEVW